MSTFTIPGSLQPAFRVTERTQICDEQGKLLGYYTPVQEVTDEDFEWVSQQMTPELIGASLNSGPGRTFAEIIADLRSKNGP